MFFLLSVFHKIFYETILRKLLRRTTLIQYIGVRVFRKGFKQKTNTKKATGEARALKTAGHQPLQEKRRECRVGFFQPEFGTRDLA